MDGDTFLSQYSINIENMKTNSKLELLNIFGTTSTLNLQILHTFDQKSIKESPQNHMIYLTYYQNTIMEG